MRFRRLGRTGLHISEISLGTVGIGMDYGVGANGTALRPSETDAARLLHCALDSGINFLDTARVYGESETVLGRILKERQDEIAVCSKVFARTTEDSKLSLRELVTTSVASSLLALQLHCVDIMMIHSASVEIIASGNIRQILEDLKKEGKFHWIGVSVYEEEAALTAIKSGEYDCIQIAYNLLDRRSETQILPEAERLNIGIISRSVLLKGALTGRGCYLPETMASLKTASRQMDSLASEAGMSLPEMAYRYVLNRSVPHTVLTGATTVEELEYAIACTRVGPLPPELIERIHEIHISDERQLDPSTWPIG